MIKYETFVHVMMATTMKRPKRHICLAPLDLGQFSIRKVIIYKQEGIGERANEWVNSISFLSVNFEIFLREQVSFDIKRSVNKETGI